jgi:hypothetical protein
MRLILALPIALTFLISAPTVPAFAGCRMEKQCHWKNFKKYCVLVKVCR